MSGILVGLGVVVCVGLLLYLGVRKEQEANKLLSPDVIAANLARREEEESRARVERRQRYDDVLYGPIRPAVICPHCQQKGGVRAKEVKRKKGVSGGKAAAAVLTAGVSVLATGLSRKELVTEARCSRCESRWTF